MVGIVIFPGAVPPLGGMVGIVIFPGAVPPLGGMVGIVIFPGVFPPLTGLLAEGAVMAGAVVWTGAFFFLRTGEILFLTAGADGAAFFLVVVVDFRMVAAGVFVVVDFVFLTLPDLLDLLVLVVAEEGEEDLLFTLDEEDEEGFPLELDEELSFFWSLDFCARRISRCTRASARRSIEVLRGSENGAAWGAAACATDCVTAAAGSSTNKKSAAHATLNSLVRHDPLNPEPSPQRITFLQLH